MKGVNRLITSMLQAGIGPNQNVYAELGTTWYRLMPTPDQAAHVLGKLLKYVGEDNVLWGTDSIWYGSPQDQIQAFRAFQIAPELQEQLRLPGAHRRPEGEDPRSQRAAGLRREAGHDEVHVHPGGAGRRCGSRRRAGTAPTVRPRPREARALMARDA